MFYKTITIIICLFLCFSLFAQEKNIHLLMEKALYYERVLGDLDKAIKIYDTLLTKKASTKIREKLLLHKAFCYERLGKTKESIKIYNTIKKTSQDKEIIRLINLRIREYRRREQIENLKKKLNTLVSPELKHKLEKEIEKLHKRIKILGKQEPKAKPTNDPKKEQKRIGDILCSHLYNIGKNLYEKGFYVGAKENLKKALYFNANNKKAFELLKKVELEIKKNKEKKQPFS